MLKFGILHFTITLDPNSVKDTNGVTIAVIISSLVVILIAIASVTAIFYWRFKLKMTRERQVTLYKISYVSTEDVKELLTPS